MIPYLSAFCYVTFFILALVSPFMPLFLMWRIAAFSGVAFVLGELIEGPIHWSDKNLGYAIAMAILSLFCTGVGVLLTIRIIHAATHKRLNLETIIGPDGNARKFFDIAILIATGCVVGLWLTIVLSKFLSGASIGEKLDIGVAVSAFILAISLFWLFKKRHIIFFSAAFVTLAISASIGSFQMRYILKQGERIADGRAWCLATADQTKQISDIDQLGFFSLAKRESYPHLGLLVRDNDSIELAAHWSIRQQTFVMAGGQSVTCHAIKDFAAALENDEIESHIYTIGSDVYSIPDTYQPRAFTDRLSIRSDILVGSHSTYPKMTERMELIYNPAKPYVPKDAISLKMIHNPDEVNINDLITGKTRFTFSRTDEATGQHVLLECLHGAYVDRNCYVQVFDNSMAYKFFLPFHEINRWEEALSRIQDLFQSLQMPPQIQ